MPKPRNLLSVGASSALQLGAQHGSILSQKILLLSCDHCACLRVPKQPCALALPLDEIEQER